MNKQTYENINPFIEDLLKMQQSIYLACDVEVAADISLKIHKAITLISELVIDNKRLDKELAQVKEL